MQAVSIFRYAVFCIAALLASANAARAQGASARDVCPPQYSNEFQLYIENDMWSGTDRYYTNGIKFGFGTDSGTLADLLNAPSESVLRQVTNGEGCVQLGLFFGQNMYTPRRITVARSQPADRPWAAWLYVGGVAQRVQERKLQTVEIDLGMVGPAALGRQVQTEWHKLIGVDRPEGWANQIPNQPGVLIAYVEKLKFGSRHFEIVPHFGGSLGNVMTLARAGGIVRFGRNMTGFGPDTIEPGGAMLQATRVQSGESGKSGVEWYAFAGLDVRAVAYNIFLDGPWFRDSPSVERRPLVHDWTVGVSARVSTVRVSVTRVQRSEEFTTPTRGGGTQSFYSFNLGVQF
ncbi:MAG: lipid A deacylase LpxR family protein [Rhodospirillaceae bacterium]